MFELIENFNELRTKPVALLLQNLVASNLTEFSNRRGYNTRVVGDPVFFLTHRNFPYQTDKEQ